MAIISVTNKAVNQIKKLLEKRETTTIGIRIGVKSGGCSGMSYHIEYAEEKREFDELVEVDGVKILIDPKAFIYIVGSEMDYVDSKLQSGFQFNNPNEKSKCGCGKSFRA